MATKNKIVQLEPKIIQDPQGAVGAKVLNMIARKNDVLEHIRLGKDLKELSDRGYKFVGTL